MTNNINVIIRIDDIIDKNDLYDLKRWFLAYFPHIPLCIYLMATHHQYRWPKKAWTELKALIKKFKWEVGGHARSHPYLSKISSERLKLEIVENIKDIEKGLESVSLNYKVTSFAYPYGDFDSRVKEILKLHDIIHGLTYISNKNYISQLVFPRENLYEIGISCNALNSIEDWNKRFKEVYENGDTYILCLHTSHWNRGRNRLNILRILKSRSIKELYNSMRRFLQYLFKRSKLFMWDNLKQHLEFISGFSNIKFVTFKDLLEN